MTFLLVVILLLGGEYHEFVVDSGLTLEDCAQVLTENIEVSSALLCVPEEA